MIAGFCLVVLAAMAEAAPPPPVHAVLLHADDRVTSATLPLPEEVLRDAKELWAWTDALPPRRFKADEFARFTAAPHAELARDVRGRIKLQLTPALKKEQLASMQVILAPVGMWQSIPESLLPRFAIAENGTSEVPYRDPALRARLIGKGLGSGWTDLQPSARPVLLHVRRAATMEIATEGAEGKAVERPAATLFRPREGRSAATVQAQLQANARGLFRIESVPEDEIVRMLVFADGYAPAAASGAPGDLKRVRMSRGTRASGAFEDAEGKPLAGVKVETEAWAGTALMKREAVSDERGAWALDHLPAADTTLHASHKGFAAVTRKIRITGDRLDLGVITLEKAAALTLAIADPDKNPVAGARVSVNGVAAGTSDRAGSLVVEGLSTSSAAAVTVRADGFQPADIKLEPPFRTTERIVLQPAFTISGVVVDEQQRPVDNVLVKVDVANTYRTHPAGADGRFSIAVAPEAEVKLTFDSPSFAPLTRTEEPGRSGENRDLGSVVLPSGLAISGRVFASGEPVAGARVWVLRAAAEGAIAAWLANRTSEARTQADGTFTLRGLAAGPAIVRIDAPGFARAQRQMSIAEASTDAGTIELTPGSTVRVTMRENDTAAEAVARLDLQGRWLDLDMVSAPVVDGTARIRHVPPGRYTVSVLQGPTIVCERSVTVPDSGAEATVDCGTPTTVRGLVVIGGAPAPGGTLSWRSGEQQQVQSVIVNTMSPLGTRRQDVYGIDSGHLVTPLNDDGRFITTQLRPGTWQVVWTSGDRATSEPRIVQVPDAREAELTIEYANSLVRGRVVDDEQQPVAGAHIADLDSAAVAMSRPDGTFAFTSLADGTHRLRATLGDRSSEPVEVVIARDRVTPDVTLSLTRGEGNTLTISVAGPNGEPAGNAFIFVESNGVSRIVTADASGIARASFSEGIPKQGRLAAFAQNAWTFGDLASCERSGECRVAMQIGATGALSLESRSASGAPLIVTANGTNLSLMLARLGTPPSVVAGTPLVVPGLPAGTYHVTLGGTSQSVTANAGDITRVELP